MFLTALTWRIQPMKEKGKTRNIKAYEIIILTVLVIFAVIAFLKAFSNVSAHGRQPGKSGKYIEIPSGDFWNTAGNM